MDIDRIDQIEKKWIAEGKRRDIDYLWLAHGKYVRNNPDFDIGARVTRDKAPKAGFWRTRSVIARFYDHYITRGENAIHPDRCCITGGCRDGVAASLKYFKATDDRHVLYLVPTFQPLIEIGRGIFDLSRIHYLKHFNEPWEQTLQHIETLCDRRRIGCIVYANPNNPAGIMYPEKVVEKLGSLSRGKKIWVVEDGAYFLHYAKARQTSIIDHTPYAVSLITSLKLLLGKHAVGGAVLGESIDAQGFAGFTANVSPDHQVWFEELLSRVALENPAVLANHLSEMFRVSAKTTSAFTRRGFFPLYGAPEGVQVLTSIGPVISFAYRKKNGETVSPDNLFEILRKHFILTTPLAEGIRINSRGITDAGINLLDLKLGLVEQEFDP